MSVKVGQGWNGQAAGATPRDDPRSPWSYLPTMPLARRVRFRPHSSGRRVQLSEPVSGAPAEMICGSESGTACEKGHGLGGGHPLAGRARVQPPSNAH